MNVYTWIFTGLLLVDLLLYIIALIQRIQVLEMTSRGLFIPLTGGLIISLLVLSLPDSHHIIFIASFAFFTASLFMLSVIKNKKRFFKFAEHFLFIITQGIWFLLIVSVYRIFRIPELFFVLSGILFIAGFIVICVFIKKQTLLKYASALIQYFLTAGFVTTALISLVYEKRLFGILIFCGSLLNLFYVVFEIFQSTRPFDLSRKKEKLLMTIILVSANALTGSGALLMQF